MPSSTGIDTLYRLSDWLHGLPAKRVMMFIDACCSGAAGGRTFGGPRFMANRHRFRSDLVSVQVLELVVEWLQVRSLSQYSPRK
jgi:hypothetical protein